MSKRQIRISDSKQLQARLQEFMDKKINLVMHDNTVLFGKLVKIENGAIRLQNMRLKNVTIAVTKIQELYTDVDA